MIERDARSLRAVLAGLVFPAWRWEIVTRAGWYGADARTTDRLRRLPARPYRDLRDIMATLDDIASR
jgi:uncharacterized protein DUF2795